MKILGITGGTGAGKTTALQALSHFDATLIDADAVYHELTQKSLELRQALETRFGDLYDENAVLDRKKLGKIVFNDPEALQELNEIVKGFISQELNRLMKKAEQEGKQLVVIDAIALVESGLAKICDATIAVVAPIPVRIVRIMNREGISEEYARMRVDAQQPELFYRENCDYILENKEDDSLESFSAKALSIFETILK